MLRCYVTTSAAGLYNMTVTGGLGLLSISTEGDQEWRAEISNISHSLSLALQSDAHCDDTGRVLHSSLHYEDTQLDMQGLDRSVVHLSLSLSL